MDQSFENWDDSGDRLVRSHPSGDSIVISDSDEDVVENSVTTASAIVVESYDEDTDSGPSTSKQYNEKHLKRVVQRKIKIESDSDESADESQEEYHTISHLDNSDSDKENFADSISYSPIENNGSKKKDIIHNRTTEKIKGLDLNYSNKSLVNNSHKQNAEIIHEIQDYKISDHEISDHEVQKMETFHDVVTIVHDTDSSSERHSESEVALAFAKQEIGVGNIDPLVAQKRAVLVCKLEQLKNQLTKTKLLLTQGNIEILPDKGERLHKSIREQETEIEKLTLELEKTPLVQSLNIQENKVSKESHSAEKESCPSPIKDEQYSDHSDYSYLDIDNIPMKPTTSPELRELGEKAQATRDRELALTVERLQDLHGSLVARPTENEKAKDPRGLKVQLMPHQQHALAWLLWREQQRPAGGVLADDMGLGKTLTMISLIMTTLTKKDSMDESDDSDDDEWNNDHKHLYHKGGTLVVCPASLLFQWDNEVQNRCKRGLLTVEIYHGSNRESVPKRLSKNDIVITTYNILSREHKTRSTLYKINWKRVILDEAHVIRNHKSQASLAVCELKANKRWALTGTPIQNKAMDLYSILKFLKCSPFDDLRVWKRWVDNKNAAGNQRLATVMKSLMLRRTKQELIEKGDLESLPDKFIEEVIVNLDPQEQLVYEKVLIYSRTLFAQFLVQKAEKEHMSNLYSGNDKLAYLSNPNIPFSKAQNELMAMHADVKTHQILVLLLRLRQLCCHPPLIHTMLDQDDMRHNEITDTENVDPDLLLQMSNVSLKEIDTEEKKEVDIDKTTQNLLTAENPVFHDDRISSKMGTLLNKVKEILQKSEDKLIIVSQWTSLLNVIALHLSSIKGATFNKFTGDVAIKDRQNIIDSFNNRNSDPKILLLSLTAGGVGLNLVGANHLLLFDIHWNPQLETQAQDRIYRFGQKKNVHIYKFICVNTIEERIKVLQDRKLEIASSVLSGDKNNGATKLTLNDLKSLFGF